MKMKYSEYFVQEVLLSEKDDAVEAKRLLRDTDKEDQQRLQEIFH